MDPKDIARLITEDPDVLDEWNAFKSAVVDHLKKAHPECEIRDMGSSLSIRPINGHLFVTLRGIVARLSTSLGMIDTAFSLSDPSYIIKAIDDILAKPWNEVKALMTSKEEKADRMALVYKLYHGVGLDKEYSLNEIAEALGISREFVRMLLAKETVRRGESGSTTRRGPSKLEP